MKGNLVWVDIETTGLDPEYDRILEIACIVTDNNLDVLVGKSWTLHFTRTEQFKIDPVVVKMHSSNDLFRECALSDLNISDVWDDLSDLLAESASDKPMLAGSSVHFDRLFLRKYLPAFDALLSHRHFDTSALKTAMRMWSPESEVREPGKVPAHRALTDIVESISSARSFRDTFFQRNCAR